MNKNTTNELLSGQLDEGEYHAFYHTYIDLSRGKNLFNRLEQSKDAFLAMAATLTDEKALHRYAEEKWSIKEIIGHITDNERIMAFRALSFARGEKAGIPGYDHETYVQEANFDELPLHVLLNNYINVRKSSIDLFETFSPGMLLREGTASNRNFSVRALGFIIAGHEMHHLNVIKKKYLPGL